MDEKFWENLLFALKHQQCVLVLGSGISTGKTEDGQERPLTEMLANHLADLIEQDNKLVEGDRNNLFQIASEFVNINGLTTLHRVTQTFYAQYTEPNALQLALACLPFHLIFNAAPDLLFYNALERADKLPKSFSYKLQGSERSKFYESIPKPTAQHPVVFNMLGNWQEPGSLVLTEGLQLDFLQDVIRHQDAIPNTLLEICNTNKSTFVFAGFDFERWQLRLLLRALGLDRDANIEHWALQPRNALKKDTWLFFKEEYGLLFRDEDTLGFVEEWKNRYEKSGSAVAAPNPVTVNAVLLYASEDESFKKELDAHLAPLREHQHLNTWNEAMIMPGQELESAFQKAIDEAHLILLLASADFVNSEDLYHHHLEQAMERFKSRKAKIFPIIVRNFAWQGSLFGQLPIVLPQENGVVKPVAEWAQRDTAYADIVSLIERHIKYLMDDLKKSAAP
ncbi:MAG: SIR2 family protein [Bacteroidetes bacterium]|nr:SIR2 family protein [Bacteroidota bacterium]